MGVVALEDPRRAVPVEVSEAPEGFRTTFVPLGTGVDEPEGVLVLQITTEMLAT